MQSPFLLFPFVVLASSLLSPVVPTTHTAFCSLSLSCFAPSLFTCSCLVISPFVAASYSSSLLRPSYARTSSPIRLKLSMAESMIDIASSLVLVVLRYFTIS